MEKKKIAFIELETHSALLEQWYLLLKEMQSVDFFFFVSPKVKSKITAIPKDCMTLVQNAKEIESKLAGFDAVVVNTFHRHFEQYQTILEQKKGLVVLHNLNFSLFFKSVNLQNIWTEKARLTYFLKLYFAEKIRSRRKAILKAVGFGVLSQSLFDEVNSRSSLAAKTKLIQMNYCQSHSFPASEVINIVMPGNVSGKRKDIKSLFEVLPKLNPQSKLHFTFLGKPESDEVLKQLEDLKQSCSDKITITHYHRFIPWEEYSGEIAKSHLLLCPIKNETSFYLVDEIYGKTKVSGSEADCIYNGKIGLFPTSYPKMNWHNLYYENASDLEAILNNLTLGQLSSEYEKLQPYLKQYTFESVKTHLENQLLALANSK
ncbi:hypothetical protein FLJC2902T_20840 [Flavobacterium limnosediminis JC2902]|uniref:Glycosyl transferase family 1 domain-containing protein n=1 Tax=Flavobacterium limnosediminis JC2902 TaxID=1341181 RepID=V6SLR3_9FLAO|nr:hypothetical protein [Flavobacterium limnosediminis]ESU27379.1 hypothetical protein FLJC2902T_20840 [Flavobacterium limnosediminis JC2902]